MHDEEAFRVGTEHSDWLVYLSQPRVAVRPSWGAAIDCRFQP